MTISRFILGLAGVCAATAVIGSARAESFWTIYPSTLTPQERAQFAAAPLGDRDPFGNLASPNCFWTRLQVPTAAGLEWIAQEECDGAEGNDF